VIHLDKVLWQPGCRLTEPDQEPRVVAELLDHPRWVIDGNYTASLPMRLTEADTVVVVDFPRWRCIARAFKRLLQFRGRARPDMGGDCAEQLNFAFLKWIWRYPKHERPKLHRYLAHFGRHTRIIWLRSPADVARFLRNVRENINANTLGAPAAPAAATVAGGAA
jgi:adenylate kinase family enzyme